MKDIKKLMMTLALLLTAVTGAWAQPWTSGDCTVTISDNVMTVSGNGAMADYEDTNYTPWYGYCDDIVTIVIESGVTSIGKFDFSRFEKLESISIPASVTSIGKSAFGECGTNADAALTVSFAEGSKLLTIGDVAFRYANLKSIDIPNGVTSIGEQAFYSCSNLESVSIPASVTSIGEGAFYNCGKLAKVYIYAPSLTTYGAAAFDDNATGRKIYVLSDAVDTYKAGWPAYAADFVGDLKPLAPSGPEVTPVTGKTNEWTFTMPGGNVTLEPEYYPQAALTAAPTAVNDVPATTDGAILKAGTVATIGETTTAQGTVMYYVSQTALDDAALLALAADQWTADVPTAADLTQGQAYVYYYVRGNDSDTDAENFSDGDILAANKLTVTIAAEPTYAVSFAEGTDEPTLWKAEPAAGVKKGTPVTVTYTGNRKVIGVKAEKKAAGNIVDLSTYSGTSYEVTEDVTFTGTTNNEISILYKGEGYEVTLDNVNAPKCYIAAEDDIHTENVKLKGTSRLAGIYGLNANINIGEAAAGGTVILVGESPLGASGSTITINGGTVKAKTSSYSTLYNTLVVNGGAVYLEGAEDYAAVDGDAEGSVTVYGWNGSAWEAYSNHRYLSTDNSKAPTEWTW